MVCKKFLQIRQDMQGPKKLNDHITFYTEPIKDLANEVKPISKERLTKVWINKYY